MSSDELRYVVSVGINRIRIIPREIAGVLPELPTVSHVALEVNRWEFSPKAIVKKRSHCEARGQGWIVEGGEEYVVGRVAGHEFI